MKLIGICGKKGSGKTTLARSIQKIFQNMGQKASIFSMATPLKNHCIDDLGLTYDQLYGSEEDKNSLTEYKWENLPHYERIVQKIYIEEEDKALKEWKQQPWWCRLYEKYSGALEDNILNRVALKVPTGNMTARQVIQEVGTGIFRSLDNNYWIKQAKKALEEDQSYNNDIKPSDIIIFDDIRFPNEADMIKEYNGILVKLIRGDTTNDSHLSENLDYQEYNIIIPNNLDQDQTLEFFKDKFYNVY